MTYDKILPCKCGADARIRFRDPYVWVECKKKCGMKSGYIFEFVPAERWKSEQKAVDDWNRLVGENRYNKSVNST